MQLPSHIRHCMSSESSLSAFRQLVHKRHPHLSLVQLLNLRQITHPITLRTEGAVYIYSWLSILTPSPQMGALDSMSMILQLSRESQWEHQTRLRLMIPLQQVSLSCFLQPLHRILSLSLMGESVTWINLLGFTSQMLSTGLPSDMERVVKRYCGGQCSSDCPSGLVILMQSMVFLTNATLSIRVQYWSGLGLAGRLSLLPLRMMLQCSRVNCSMVECLRSPSHEKRAVLLLFMKFLVLTDRLDSFQRMLPRPQTDSFLSSFWPLVLVSHRSVSGSSCLGLLGSGSFLGGLSISRQQAPISPSQYQFKPPLQPSHSQSQQRSPKNTIFSPYCHQGKEGVARKDFLLSLGMGTANTGMIGAHQSVIIIQLQMSEDKDANIYVVEQVQISSDSDTQQLLEDVHDLDDLQNSLEDIDQLEGLMRSTLRKTQLTSNNQSLLQNYQPKHVRRLEVVDDYIRNFLTRHGMSKTLNSFQKEWYECVKGKEDVPDAEIENEVLKDQIEQLRDQLQKAVVLSEKAKATYDKLLKERDFHKMHHQRVQRDKKKLNENIERLYSLQREYEKKYEQLAEKYNFTMKEKMLIKIERDKLKAETTVKKEPLPSVDTKTPAPDGKKTKFTPFPEDEPAPSRIADPFNYKQTVLGKTQKGHTMSVCTVVFHPKKPIIGTGSDDMFWKIWTVNQSELIMSGQGHRDWVSSMKFHPRGHHILTGSGDSTVKVWDFVHSTCTFTFKDHRQPVWSIDLNRTGDYVATGSLDASCRLLDINVGKCRSVFRGHVDSVSSVHFQPTSNLLASASADKTLSIWDTRMALCIQTFYGHQGAVTGCKFNIKGDRLASCDATGVVKTWDLRGGKEANTFSTDKRAANCISIDRSGSILAVGTDDALIMLFNDASGQKEVTLRGHEEKTKVQAVQFDMNSKMIVSGGSDCSYRIWQ